MSNTYHNDDYIRIDHSPQTNSDATANNAIGATTSATLRTIDFTPSDSNCIYVDGVNGLDTNTGTSASPVKTISKANQLITATKTRIYIIDSETYNENQIILSSDLSGIYSAVGQIPTININIDSDEYDFLLTFENDFNAPSKSGVCELENGDIFVIYTGAANTYCKTIDGNTHIVNNDRQTIFTGTSFAESACCLTSDGNIFVIGINSSTRDVQYFVLDKTDYTNFIKTLTTFSSGTFYYPTCQLKDNNDILIMYDNSSNIYYGIIDDSSGSYGIVTSQTLFVSSRLNCEINKLSNDNFLICYLGSNTLYYTEVQQDLTVITSETSTGLTGIALEHSEAILHNDRIAICYDNNDFVAGQGRTFSYKIFESDFTYNTTIGEQDTGLGTGANIIMINSNEVLQFIITDIKASTPYPMVYRSKIPIIWLLETNSICKFDGLILETNSQKGIDYYLLQNEDITFKHCTIQNIENIAGYNNIKFLDNQNDYDVIITNCAFLDSYLDNTLITNNADIQQNIFFNVINSPCITIDGNGVNIIFDHNTFFNCYAGIKLSNNDGNEIIKNCILHEMINNDIQCDTTLEIKSCLYTGTLDTCTADSNSINTNPRFINEGIESTDNLDLNLKSKSLGNDYTSPAISNANDDQDMGAYDRNITYNEPTYSTINIQKPDQIDIQYNAVGIAKNINLDGTVRTYKDGANKELVLKWSGILNADYEDLLDFWFNHEGQVRVYLDPITNPSEYETYYLEFKNISGSPKKSPLLSKVGVSDVSMTLIKAYKG